MEKPKQPTIFKRHRGRGFGERQPKRENRQTRSNFFRKAVKPGSGTQQHTKVPFGTRKAKRRAREKRARQARKLNRP